MEAGKGYMVRLDALRGCAILLVLIHHVLQMNGFPLCQVGNFTLPDFNGAHLFFVLSGFLITSVLLKTKSESDYYSHFFARRFWRTCPLYYCYLFVVFSLLPQFLPGLPAVSSQQPYLFFYTNWSLLAGEGANGLTLHLWSMAVQEQFYLLWPFYVRRLSTPWLLLMLGLMFVSSTAVRIFVHSLGGSSFNADLVTIGSLDNLALGAAVAVCIFHLGRDRMARYFSSYRTIAVVFLVLSFVLKDGSLMDTAVSLFYTAILLCILTAKETSLEHKALNIPVLAQYGRCSYFIYIFHMLIFVFSMRIISPVLQHFGMMTVCWLVELIVSGVVLGVLGSASFKWVEQPLMRMSSVSGRKPLTNLARRVIRELKIMVFGDQPWVGRFPA